MNANLAFGWRNAAYKYSAGQDFLGLAVPVDRILDLWTPGITNATDRARYYTIMPWIHYQFAKLGGRATKHDQERFVLALETFFAYVNVAHSRATGVRVAGVIRRISATVQWRKSEPQVPLRTARVPKTPSAMDPAVYKPSFSRLELLGEGTTEGFVACFPAGQVLAESFNQVTVSLPGRQKIFHDETLPRDVVAAWASDTNLDAISSDERKLLRALFFAYGPFAGRQTLNRVRSLLLILWLALHADGDFTDWDIEIALASGRTLSGDALDAPANLKTCALRWRVVCLLKLFRRAAELAFKSLHEYVQTAAVVFARAGAAARALVTEYCQEHGDPSFSSLWTRQRRSTLPPDWEPGTDAPTAYLHTSLCLAAWCYAQLRRESGQQLLQERVASLGAGMGSSIDSYAEEMTAFDDRPLAEFGMWLLVDRGIARHNRVAAGKLWQHDTYRLIEDERGLKAVGRCPLPAIQIRIDAMLSLLADLNLLSRQGNSYRITTKTAAFLERQLERNWD